MAAFVIRPGSYTMMGYGSDTGLIPRICEELFVRISAATAETPHVSFNVEASYMEIYNERVKDLLATSDASGNLKVGGES